MVHTRRACFNRCVCIQCILYISRAISSFVRELFFSISKNNNSILMISCCVWVLHLLDATVIAVAAAAYTCCLFYPFVRAFLIWFFFSLAHYIFAPYLWKNNDAFVRAYAHAHWIDTQMHGGDLSSVQNLCIEKRNKKICIDCLLIRSFRYLAFFAHSFFRILLTQLIQRNV